jgi:FMN-dependent NADH-azoreductase
VVVYSSSFVYAVGDEMQDFDYQKNYFEHWLKVIGCNDISTVTIAPTAAPEDVLLVAKALASEQAKDLARNF